MGTTCSSATRCRQRRGWRIRAIVVAGALTVTMFPATAQAAAPTLRVRDVTVTETNAAGLVARVPVVLSRAASRRVTVQYTTVNGTAKAPADYTAKNGTLAFPAGVRKKLVAVAIKGDTLDEANEVFRLRVFNPVRAVIADNVGVVTINDNDPLPALTAANAQAVEPNVGSTQLLSIPITLSAPSARTVSVAYMVTSGTATLGSDFSMAAASGILSFPAGTLARDVTVTVIGDNVDEANETLDLSLADSVKATIADGSAVGTIIDNDGPNITISNVTRTEGWTANNMFNFTVSLSAPSTQEVRVNYATANGSAFAPTDYTGGSGTLVFAPGQTAKSVSVAVQGDVAVEPNEAFFVNLSGAMNAIVADGQGMGTILNDDCSSFDEGRAAALNLGAVSGDTGAGVLSRTDNICVGDADWYRFTLTENQFDLFSRDLTARIFLNVWDSPPQTSGDLDIEVYRANGAWVGSSSAGGTNDETFFVKKADPFISGDDSTTVYVRVFGFGGTKMNTYTLSINGNLTTGIAPNL